MIANLYIGSETFTHNGYDVDEEVYKKIYKLYNLIEYVISRFGDDNIFYLNKANLLNAKLLDDNSTFGDIINYRRTINNDILIIFFKLLGKCKKDNSRFNSILEKLDAEDEDNCNGLVVFNLIDGLPQNQQVISNIKGWFEFRRYYLGKYPKNTEFFISECRKYFNNLVLHPDNTHTIKKVLKTHSIKIVIYLSALNDNFAKDLKVSKSSYPEFIKEFAINHNLDGASLEGRKKDIFKFTFCNEKVGKLIAYCESHLKIYKNDKDELAHCRIYFKKPDVSDSIVYVGHIGFHL